MPLGEGKGRAGAGSARPEPEEPPPPAEPAPALAPAPVVEPVAPPKVNAAAAPVATGAATEPLGELTAAQQHSRNLEIQAKTDADFVWAIQGKGRSNVPRPSNPIIGTVSLVLFVSQSFIFSGCS